MPDEITAPITIVENVITAPITLGVAGKSAYQSYVDTTTDDPVLTEAQWIASFGGSAPSGTGYTQVVDGAWTTPSATIPNADVEGLGGAALLNVGTSVGTVAAGDDSRLSDERTPTSHAHSWADITSGTQPAPTAHAPSHGPLGSDPVTPVDIGAAKEALIGTYFDEVVPNSYTVIGTSSTFPELFYIGRIPMVGHCWTSNGDPYATAAFVLAGFMGGWGIADGTAVWTSSDTAYFPTSSSVWTNAGTGTGTPLVTPVSYFPETDTVGRFLIAPKQNPFTKESIFVSTQSGTATTVWEKLARSSDFSGTNTGDETATSVAGIINATSAIAVMADDDRIGATDTSASGVLGWITGTVLWTWAKAHIESVAMVFLVKGYTESPVAIGTVTTSNTLVLTNGTKQKVRLTASTACTFTMPAVVDGKSFVLCVEQAAATGNGTATFTGVDWGTVGAPTITATAGKMDILSFLSDGTKWYGSAAQGYTY